VLNNDIYGVSGDEKNCINKDKQYIFLLLLYKSNRSSEIFH